MDSRTRYAKKPLYSRRMMTPRHRAADLEDPSEGSVLAYAKEPLNSRRLVATCSSSCQCRICRIPGLAQPDSRIRIRVSAATSVPVPHATRSYASVGTTPGPSLHSTVSLVLTRWRTGLA